MVPCLAILAKKLTFLVVVVCLLNMYMVRCEGNQHVVNENSMIVSSNSDSNTASDENDEQTLMELTDSDEHNGELHNLDYLNKLKLLEIFLNEIKRKELKELQELASQQQQQRSNSRLYNSKRSFLRAMKDSDRKRPGWELAYGRRKRSVAV